MKCCGRAETASNLSERNGPRSRCRRRRGETGWEYPTLRWLRNFLVFAERQPKLYLVHCYANIKWLLMQAAHVYFMYAYVF